MVLRKIREPVFDDKSQESEDLALRQRRYGKASFREKPLSSKRRETVPQTDTGSQVEKTKANE